MRTETGHHFYRSLSRFYYWMGCIAAACITSVATCNVRVRKPKFHLHNFARWFWIFHFLIYFPLHRGRCRRFTTTNKTDKEKIKIHVIHAFVDDASQFPLFNMHTAYQTPVVLTVTASEGKELEKNEFILHIHQTHTLWHTPNPHTYTEISVFLIVFVARPLAMPTTGFTFVR